MGKIGARQDGGFKAISTAPSFNKTPVGNSIPPLPYPTTQDLGNSASPAKSVRFNGNAAYVIDKTTQPGGTGDGPGTAKGVRSGTVTGKVKPTGAAKHFRAENHYVVQQGDTNTMNGGNNPGIYITTQMPSVGEGGAAASVAAGFALPSWMRASNTAVICSMAALPPNPARRAFSALVAPIAFSSASSARTFG